LAADPEDLLGFWFPAPLDDPATVAERARLWFSLDADFDAEIRERFGALPARARAGGLDDWRRGPRSCLALTLVLDQLPRNLYRDTAECFAYDALAHELAQDALARGVDAALAPLEAAFLYLPLEHAEDPASQQRCVSLFRDLVSRAPAALRPQFESFVSYAVRHRDVIARFGRFPHRNRLLGRASTPQERAYLEAGGETFA
jgi:uncharacterized protein (DUF924 family)